MDNVIYRAAYWRIRLNNVTEDMENKKIKKFEKSVDISKRIGYIINEVSNS